MTLERLIFLCVKNTIYQDESSFTFNSFQTGEWDGHTDYSLFVNNAFMPINEAIARLSDLNKIPYKLDVAKVDSNGIVDLTKNGSNEVISVKEVKNIATQNYKVVNSMPFGIGKQRIINYNDNTSYYIEYKEDIPYLDNTNDTTTKAVDLKQYGITDSMCNYIMEYTMAKLYEQIDVSVSNMHITRAEQYFHNIKDVTSAFRVVSVNPIHKIGA